MPVSQQAVNSVNLLVANVLRAPPSRNVIAVASYFNNRWGSATDKSLPRLQAQLDLIDSNGTRSVLVATNTSWLSFDATPFHNPSGDSGHSWYHVPNEDLNVYHRPLGWEQVDFVADSRWKAAVVQPPFPKPLYIEPSPPPATLWRRPCSITQLRDKSYVIDFGQEFMGGVNISFPGQMQTLSSKASNRVWIRLGEELLASGAVMSPTRAAENYTSVWTLDPSGGEANIGLFQHEFVQFRYAQLSGVSFLNASSMMTHVLAWVVQHPVGGNGVNPFEVPCARSTPNVVTYEGKSDPQVTQHFGWFESDNKWLNRVFNFTAYTALATALDINVDSQTRQRDLCHVDAAITNAEQYAVFPSGDNTLQRKTAMDAFGNDSNIWSSSMEFKMSAVLMAYMDALETGDFDLISLSWSDNDESITADNGNGDYNSLQFMAGVRYFNGSDLALMYYPENCGGSWGCDALIDWPTQTRDDYVVSGTDAIRNGLAAYTLQSLSNIASWLHKVDAAQRYQTMSNAIRSSILSSLLRANSSSNEAYFVDGANESHSAIHSTIYSIIAGAADNNSSLANQLSSYLRRRDFANSSCMTARWYVEALYRLGLQDTTAADFALELLSRNTYPSWGNMIVRGATTTLEAWAPEDKVRCCYYLFFVFLALKSTFTDDSDLSIYLAVEHRLGASVVRVPGIPYSASADGRAAIAAWLETFHCCTTAWQSSDSVRGRAHTAWRDKRKLHTITQFR